MQTDQLSQEERIAALFSQDNQQLNPYLDPSQSFQNTQNISEPMPPPNGQQNFPIQENSDYSLFPKELQQQAFRQVRCRRASKL